MNITKNELMRNIAKIRGITLVEAQNVVDSFNEGLVATVAEMNVGDKITLHNFISIEKIETQAREGRHPRTKEVITIDGKKKLKIKSGKLLNEVL